MIWERGTALNSFNMLFKHSDSSPHEKNQFLFDTLLIHTHEKNVHVYKIYRHENKTQINTPMPPESTNSISFVQNPPNDLSDSYSLEPIS